MPETHSRVVAAALDRYGRQSLVLDRSTDGTNEWGNPTEDYEETSFVTAFRTYPNRNTEVNDNRGEYSRDRPVLIVPTNTSGGGDNTTVEPIADLEQGDRIVYPESSVAERALLDGADPDDASSVVTYELQAPTRYETHVEWVATEAKNP